MAIPNWRQSRAISNISRPPAKHHESQRGNLTMKRILVIMITSILLSASALAQPIPNAVASATAVANPKDVASPSAILMALYDANSTLVDQKRDSARFRSLFVPGGLLMPTF